MRFGVLRHAHNWLGWIGAGSIAIGGICVLLAEKFGTPLGLVGLTKFHEVMKLNQGWFTPVMTAIGGTALWVQRRLGDPKVWDEVDSILAELHNDAFPGKRKDFNRVTLFKRSRLSVRVLFSFENPVGPWLCPVARSSHVNRWTATRFRVSDNGDYEGIAGKAWVQEQQVFVKDLPDLASATDGERADYISRTHSPHRYMNCKRQNFPRSILAIPVESRKDRNWGVLVFDSLDPTLDIEQAVNSFRVNTKLLGHLL